MSLVLEFREALNGASLGLLEGAIKYDRGDWRKGMPETEIVDSLLRHLADYMSGDLADPDSTIGADHLDKVLCNALMLSQQNKMNRLMSGS